MPAERCGQLSRTVAYWPDPAGPGINRRVRCLEPSSHAHSVRKTIEVEVSLINPYDQLLGEVELYITRTAKVHG